MGSVTEGERAELRREYSQPAGAEMAVKLSVELEGRGFPAPAMAATAPRGAGGGQKGRGAGAEMAVKLSVELEGRVFPAPAMAATAPREAGLVKKSRLTT